MRSSSPLAVRCGLLGVFAVLTLALVAPTVAAQFRPGMPGVPNFPRPPVMPAMPQMPMPAMPQMPGGIGGIGRPGGVGGIGGSGLVTVHTCGKCRTEMARDNNRFGFTGTCPGCGLRYTNGTAFDDGRARPPVGGGGMGGMPGFAPAPATEPSPGFEPGLPFNPNPVPAGQPIAALPTVLDLNSIPSDAPNLPAIRDQDVAPGTPADAPRANTNSDPTPSSSSAVVPKSSNRTLYAVGGVVLVLLVIAGMVVGVMYVMANAKQTRKVRRRVRRDD